MTCDLYRNPKTFSFGDVARAGLTVGKNTELVVVIHCLHLHKLMTAWVVGYHRSNAVTVVFYSILGSLSGYSEHDTDVLLLFLCVTCAAFCVVNN